MKQNGFWYEIWDKKDGHFLRRSLVDSKDKPFIEAMQLGYPQVHLCTKENDKPLQISYFAKRKWSDEVNDYQYYWMQA